MQDLRGQFDEAMLRLALNTGMKLNQPSSKQEFKLLCDQMFARLRFSIKDHFHLERTLDLLLRQMTKLPAEVHWRRALHETKASGQVEKPKISEPREHGSPRQYLYEIIKNGPKDGREKKLLRGACFLYGEKEVWDAYEIWHETGKDPLEGQVLGRLTPKNPTPRTDSH
jgi:hypothetical protein